MGKEQYQGHDVAARQVLVKFKPGAQLANAKQQEDIEQDVPVGRTGFRKMRSRTKDVATLILRLKLRTDVVYVEPDYLVQIATAPNDTRFNEQWALRNSGQSVPEYNTAPPVAGTIGADIGATAAWDITTGSRSIVVGIVDTGVDYTHPDLAPNMWSAPVAFTVTINDVAITCAAGTHGFDAINSTCDPMDQNINSHGTHVAGIIGAAGNNALGVSGVSQVASLMGLRFIDSNGVGYTSDAISAIEFAIQAKAALGDGANIRVLNNSWGKDQSSIALQEQIDLLNEVNKSSDGGILFVAAAGNWGLNTATRPFYPASFPAPNIVAVAATDNRDGLADYSNYGATTVHLGAPGWGILSTLIGGRYGIDRGTSMAAPQVSGAAALVLSVCKLNTQALKDTLLNSVDRVPSLVGNTIIGGRLNVNTALRSCAPVSMIPNDDLCIVVANAVLCF